MSGSRVEVLSRLWVNHVRNDNEPGTGVGGVGLSCAFDGLCAYALSGGKMSWMLWWTRVVEEVAVGGK